MKPTETKPTPVPWWMRADTPYGGPTPMSLRLPAVLPDHPHWTEPRLPSRAVLRNQARRRGQFKPLRHYKSKRRTGPIGRIFNSGALPLIPSFVQNFITLGRKGGDR